MNVIEFFLCVVGAFYAFAGYVATRAALTSHFVDRAIAAIGATKIHKLEIVRTTWLLVAAMVVFAGGVALMLLSEVAVWLFLLSAAGQAVYLFVLAPNYLDAADPPDAGGRRASTNAFVIYLVATAFVVWADARGSLVGVDGDWWRWAVPALLVVAHAGYIGWAVLRSPRAAGASPLAAFHPPSSGGEPSECKRIKVMADYCCHPLWALDEDLYGDFAPDRLDISAELTADLNAWADAYTASYDPDDPAISLWTEEQTSAHELQGRALAHRLAQERPDRIIYIMDYNAGGVVEIKAEA